VPGASALTARTSGSSIDVAAPLGELSRAFMRNLSSATRDFAWHVTLESELAGLSPRDLERAKHKAESAGLTGFLLTLDAHSFLPALASLDDRALRKTLYEAFYTRASDRGPRAGHFDNTATLTEMLELRYELALRSGFTNYAALALSEGVINDPDAAESALLGAHRTTRARAQAELDILWAFAKEKGAPRGFSNWDLPYYLAAWQRERLGFEASSLRDYLELETATQAALEQAQRSLDLSIVREPSVAGSREIVYSVSQGGTRLGFIELEPFGVGALLGEGFVTPIANGLRGPGPSVRIECGFEQPWDDSACICLDHAELKTLFRCLGCALFLLTTRSMSRGEAPSRQSRLGGKVAGYLYETFASQWPMLTALARHRQTGQGLPRELFDALGKGHAALDASAELEMQLFDLRVHRDHVPAGKSTQLRVQVLDTFTQVRREQSVLPASYWTRLANISTPLFVHDEAARLWERSWSRMMAGELFDRLISDASRSAEAQQRETFWAAGDAGLLERLTRALGSTPAFGR
jgi:oligopeptidase A